MLKLLQSENLTITMKVNALNMRVDSESEIVIYRGNIQDVDKMAVRLRYPLILMFPQLDAADKELVFQRAMCI